MKEVWEITKQWEGEKHYKDWSYNNKSLLGYIYI